MIAALQTAWALRLSTDQLLVDGVIASAHEMPGEFFEALAIATNALGSTIVAIYQAYSQRWPDHLVQMISEAYQLVVFALNCLDTGDFSAGGAK